MKHVKKLFVALAAGVIALTACAQKSNGNATKSQTNEDMKAVIVFFTHSGNFIIEVAA